MAGFKKAVASVPGEERFGRTPFGAPIVVHATADETGGAFGAWETHTAPGQGPARHTHTRETEVFRVIRGTYRFWCGDEPPLDAPVGTLVALPPHVPHHWRNISDEPGQMTALVTPGGCEQMFLDILALGSTDPAEIARIEARFGIVNDETEKLTS